MLKSNTWALHLCFHSLRVHRAHSQGSPMSGSIKMDSMRKLSYFQMYNQLNIPGILLGVAPGDNRGKKSHHIFNVPLG